MTQKTLYWDASYEIVLALMERYPEIHVVDVGTKELFEMIVTLPEFGDDPQLGHDGILNDILREWYEESTA